MVEDASDNDAVKEPEVDDDAEVWESDEGVNPEDNAEVWENDKDYSDETSNRVSKAISDKFKSFLKSDEEDIEDKEDVEDSESFFSSLKFTKDLGKNSDLESDFEEFLNEDLAEENSKSYDPIVEDIVEDEPNVGETLKDDEPEIIIPKFGSKVDLGSDDDYVYVDHSQDEVVEDTTKNASKEEIFEDVVENTSKGAYEVPKENVIDEDKVDLGSDDDYIYVDHSHDEEHVMDDAESEKINFKADVNKEEPVDEIDEKPQKPKTKRTDYVKSIISDVMAGKSQLEPQEVDKK